MRLGVLFGAGLLLLATLGCSSGGDPPRSTDVVAAFQEAGLEAEGARPMTREDYGLAPLKADEGTRFLIPSLGEDAGGRVLVFGSDTDLNDMREYYVQAGRESALFFSHVFTNDHILVQINGDLPDEQATRYKVALETIED